jgi:hypothetical protein
MALLRRHRGRPVSTPAALPRRHERLGGVLSFLNGNINVEAHGRDNGRTATGAYIGFCVSPLIGHCGLARSGDSAVPAPERRPRGTVKD